MTTSDPSVTDSKNARDTPQEDSTEYCSPNHELIAPGQTSVMTVTTTNASVMITAAQAPTARPAPGRGVRRPGTCGARR